MWVIYLVIFTILEIKIKLLKVLIHLKITVITCFLFKIAFAKWKFLARENGIVKHFY